MQRLRQRSLLLAAFLSSATLFCCAAFAGDGPGEAGGVTGVGTAKLDRQPELLRIQFGISAEGKDVKDALAKLREKEKSTREKLTKLGAVEKGVKVDEPRIGASAAEQQQMMMRMRGGRAQPRPTTGPSTVTVMAAIRAEWKLNAKSADELLVEAQDLSTKIKAADLAGKGNSGKTLTPEEQEAEEERALLAQASGQGGDDLSPQFVSSISEEERAKLMADAFAKAKADATRLAKAAGSNLGGLRLLTSAAGGGGMEDQSGGYYNEYSMQMRMRGMARQMPQGDGDDANEAIGMVPGKVTYRVSVTASFALQ